MSRRAGHEVGMCASDESNGGTRERLVERKGKEHSEHNDDARARGHERTSESPEHQNEAHARLD